MIRKAARFFANVFIAAKNTVVNFVRNVFRHIETITILVFASFGFNALIGELPFIMQLPMWIEGPMVIPVAAVLVVTLLVKSGEMRASRRLAVVR